MHRTRLKPRKTAVKAFWRIEFPRNKISGSNFGESTLAGILPADLSFQCLPGRHSRLAPSSRAILRGRSQAPRSTEREFQAAILRNSPQMSHFGVPGGPIARLEDQLSVPHYAPCELRRPSGAGSGRIRLLIPHPSQKIPRLKARSGGVDRGGLQVGVAQGGCDRRQRHAGGDGGDAKTMPQAFRARLGGPLTPASAMALAIFRWAVARDQGQRGLPSAFAGVERSA